MTVVNRRPNPSAYINKHLNSYNEIAPCENTQKGAKFIQKVKELEKKNFRLVIYLSICLFFNETNTNRHSEDCYLLDMRINQHTKLL